MTETKWTIIAHADDQTTPHDAECYTPAQVAAWERDEWRYVGVGAVCTVTLDCGARATFEGPVLWGIDFYCPDDEGQPRNDADDYYLREVAGEMWSEVDGVDGFPTIPPDALVRCELVQA